MHDLTVRLLEGGAAAIQALIEEGQEESLHVEFKSLSDSSGTSLARDDRKNIAIAVCGLANAEGGVLVIGIRTKKTDGADVADQLAPVLTVDRLRARLSAQLADMLGPEHTAITVHAVPSGDGKEGIIVVDVPPSDNRPHMCVPDHRYHRRGSEGRRQMDHSEIRDLMLAPRQGAVELGVHYRRKNVGSNLSFAYAWELGLRNTGRVPVVAPYMTLSAIPQFQCNNFPDFDYRLLEGKGVGYFSKRDMVLHVGQYMPIIQLHFRFIIMAAADYPPKEAIDLVRRIGREDVYHVLHHGDQTTFRSGVQPRDLLPSVPYRAGGEQVAEVAGTFSPGKAEIFEGVAADLVDVRTSS